jgi:hypothetical protein
MNNDLEGTVEGRIEVVPQHLPKVPEESHEKRHS